jgi:hypothetical protein
LPAGNLFVCEELTLAKVLEEHIDGGRRGGGSGHGKVPSTVCL